ncbi:hypothetical protein JHK82_043329 [Glycine max]|nr:hypothetical protein JHK82_043329 [Glycine max]
MRGSSHEIPSELLSGMIPARNSSNKKKIMHIDIKLLLFIIDNNLAHDNKQLDSVPILCTPARVGGVKDMSEKEEDVVALILAVRLWGEPLGG